MEGNETKVLKIKKEKPKNEKKQKDKKDKNTNWSVILIIGVVAIGLSIGAYFLLLNQEKKILDTGEKTAVYLVKEDTANGTPITESLLEKKEITVDLVPKNATLITEKDLDGSNYIYVNASKNSILTKDMLAPIAESGEKEVGVATEDLSSAINGILRTSDYIDIYVIPEDFGEEETTYEDQTYEVADIDPVTGEETVRTESTLIASGTTTPDCTVIPAFSHVYISKVFNSDGLLIPNSDTTSIVNNFNIVLSDADANYLVGALQTGTVYITKCTDHNAEAYTSNINTTTEEVVETPSTEPVSANTLTEEE